jgi:hypothetical protein
MKVQSKQKITLINDREGVLKEKIQIEIFIEKKDDISKTYLIKTADNIVYEDGGTIPYNNRSGRPQEKRYIKTYEEYDQEKEFLKQTYPSELTGSELDDYLLQMGLMYNLSIDPIYGLEGDDWEIVTQIETTA